VAATLGALGAVATCLGATGTAVAPRGREMTGVGGTTGLATPGTGERTASGDAVLRMTVSIVRSGVGCGIYVGSTCAPPALPHAIPSSANSMQSACASHHQRRWVARRERILNDRPVPVQTGRGEAAGPLSIRDRAR
jgi:hypothetical protein